MAEFNAAQAGTMSPEDYAQQQALNRQQRFAEMLMQNNQQPQGQMISGRYVAPSPWQSLQAPVNMLLGAYLGKQTDTEAAKLAEKIRQAKGAKEEAITNLITGTSAIPAVQGGIQGPNGQMTKETTADMYGSDMALNPQYKQVAPVAGKEATKPDLAAALREMNTNNPYGAGAEYKSALVGNMIPKKTDEMLNFEAAKSDGFKGSFTDYKNKMNDYQKEELKISAGRLAVDQAKAAFEMQNGKPLNESQGKAAVFHSYITDLNEYADVNQSRFDFLVSKPQNMQLNSAYENALDFLDSLKAPKYLITEDKLEAYSQNILSELIAN